MDGLEMLLPEQSSNTVHDPLWVRPDGTALEEAAAGAESPPPGGLPLEDDATADEWMMVGEATTDEGTPNGGAEPRERPPQTAGGPPDPDSRRAPSRATTLAALAAQRLPWDSSLLEEDGLRAVACCLRDARIRTVDFFAAVDQGRERRVSPQAMERALRALGIPLADGALERVVASIQRGHSNAITFSSLKRSLEEALAGTGRRGGAESPAEGGLGSPVRRLASPSVRWDVELVERRPLAGLGRYLRDAAIGLADFYDAIDQGNHKTVSHEQMCDACTDLGMPLPPEAIDAMVGTIERTAAKKITFLTLKRSLELYGPLRSTRQFGLSMSMQLSDMLAAEADGGGPQSLAIGGVRRDICSLSSTAAAGDDAKDKTQRLSDILQASGPTRDVVGVRETPQDKENANGSTSGASPRSAPRSPESVSTSMATPADLGDYVTLAPSDSDADPARDHQVRRRGSADGSINYVTIVAGEPENSNGFPAGAGRQGDSIGSAEYVTLAAPVSDEVGAPFPPHGPCRHASAPADTNPPLPPSTRPPLDSNSLAPVLPAEYLTIVDSADVGRTEPSDGAARGSGSRRGHRALGGTGRAAPASADPPPGRDGDTPPALETASTPSRLAQVTKERDAALREIAHLHAEAEVQWGLLDEVEEHLVRSEASLSTKTAHSSLLADENHQLKKELRQHHAENKRLVARLAELAPPASAEAALVGGAAPNAGSVPPAPASVDTVGDSPEPGAAGTPPIEVDAVYKEIEGLFRSLAAVNEAFDQSVTDVAGWVKPSGCSHSRPA